MTMRSEPFGTKTTQNGGFQYLILLGAINNQDDYQKNRNYWKYLKTKLKKESNELVSLTNQLKLVAPDGKRRLTDVMDSNGVILLAKNIPNNKVNDFIDWFLYSDNTIDGQSRKKAVELRTKNQEPWCLGDLKKALSSLVPHTLSY